MQDSRDVAIDTLRGVAILAVLAYHYTVRFAPEVYGFETRWPSWLRLGACGVQVFFVVSGLVIAMTVRRSRTVLEFATRRFARLFPAMLIAASFTTVVSLFGPEQFRVGLLNWLVSLTFLPTTLGVSGADGVYWTLDVEVRFYGIVALSALLFRSRFWIGVLLAAGLSVASILYPPLRGPLLAPFWPYFLAGMAAWFGLFERKSKLAYLHLALALILFCTQFPGLWETVFIFCCLAVGYLIHLTRFTPPVLPFIGLWSYSLYLLHQKVGVIVISWLTHAHFADGLSILLTAGAMIAASALMFYQVELRGKQIALAAIRYFSDQRARLAPAE